MSVGYIYERAAAQESLYGGGGSIGTGGNHERSTSDLRLPIDFNAFGEQQPSFLLIPHGPMQGGNTELTGSLRVGTRVQQQLESVETPVSGREHERGLPARIGGVGSMDLHERLKLRDVIAANGTVELVRRLLRQHGSGSDEKEQKNSAAHRPTVRRETMPSQGKCTRCIALAGAVRYWPRAVLPPEEATE